MFYLKYILGGIKVSKKNVFKDKKVLVVGMGRSGIAAADALMDQEAEICLQDSKEDCVSGELMKKYEEYGAKCCFGCIPDDLDTYDAVVISPGVPKELGFVRQAVSSGAELLGELELAYRIGKGNYVAITGTNGKTTTTTLVGEIFRASGRKKEIVGNIGTAVASKAIDATDEEWLITETSSFQLDTIRDFRPKVSAILNLAPDHLDRHKTYENYIAAKARIFENQTKEDFLILNHDDEETMKLAKASNAVVIPFSRVLELEIGAYVKDGKIVIRDLTEKMHEVCEVSELLIPGTHNLENALAAVAVSFFAGIGTDVIAGVLRTFKGVEHRIEDCGMVNGVKYVNDSKGTNPDAAIKAIQAMKENIILIAGGYDKGSDFTEFVNMFRGRVKHVFLIGKTAVKIKDTAEKQGFTETTIVKDMDACVSEAARIAKEGDVVLLSPACASWDMYQSYEKRGEHFKACVEELKK